MKRFLAALTCCGLLALCSCSDDSSSSADPPSPTPTSASSEPSPTQEVETPEEFLQRWVDADRTMENSGKTAEYRAMSKRCVACDGLASQIEDIYAKGGYVKTAGWTILSTKVSEPSAKGRVSVTMKIEAAPTEYVEAEGQSVKHLQGGTQRHLVTLSQADGSWNVDEIEQLAT